MNMTLDTTLALIELLRTPMITGLVLALSLSLLGCYLRMRGEWLAALGLSNMAAAGAAIAVLFHFPALVIATLTVSAATVIKVYLFHSGNRKRGNDYYALLILLGWSALILVSAKSHDALVGASALIDGQLYFVNEALMTISAAYFIMMVTGVYFISRSLLLERFFPDYFSANNRSPWLHRLIFEALVVAGIVLSTVSIGVMSSFALIFIPALIAFTFAGGWPAALVVATATGAVSYLISFGVALELDLPFGPVQTALLVLVLIFAYFYKVFLARRSLRRNDTSA